MPLSDEDEDDMGHYALDNDSPTSRGHSRNDSAEEGHLYAGHHSTAGVFPLRKTNQKMILTDQDFGP